MNHTQLNDDVLLHIASFADKDTLRTLMQTCPLLLHYGARRLLQDGVSLDEDDKRIWSFVTFMLKKGHSYRLKLLHSLRLTSPIYYSPHRPMLSRVTGMALATLFQSVALSGDLRSLCIFDSERFLRLHPSVPVAISMITTLEWLDVMEAGLCTVSMLGKLRSPLTRARIALAAPGREEGGTLSAYARNPMWLLRCFSHTLNRVSVTNSTCALVGPWYPHVTYLHLNSADILHTYKYVRAFPNLAVLCTNDCGVMIPPEEYEPRRARNMMDQTAFGTWASLRCYEGSFLTLYMLGITRRIPKVVINHDEDHPDYEMIRTVLDDARPIQFELSLDGAYWLLDPEFWPTFTHDGVDALRYLKLDIMLSTADEATDLPAALVSIERLGGFSRRVLTMYRRRRSSYMSSSRYSPLWRSGS